MTEAEGGAEVVEGAVDPSEGLFDATGIVAARGDLRGWTRDQRSEKALAAVIPETSSWRTAVDALRCDCGGRLAFIELVSDPKAAQVYPAPPCDS